MNLFKGTLVFAVIAMMSTAQAALSGIEAARFRELVEPIIYSPSHEIPKSLTYAQYVEKKNVPKNFKVRVEALRVEMLEQLVSIYPSLCRSDFEDVLTDCLSPLRGSEYYLIYDGGKVLGFVWIGYGVDVTPAGLTSADSVAYRYIVDRTGHVVQNGYFVLGKL
ncbi:MAG: hypothetical protein KUL82_09330 [Bdellovibrio sp.]|uniref:hypothetical protein n=1 Tax=Bdellovibrio sp. TaxID=28201 RepID=UPI0039E6C7F6|nr:hypothetical protein [Bdellovibrio sp.]